MSKNQLITLVTTPKPTPMIKQCISKLSKKLRNCVISKYKILIKAFETDAKDKTNSINQFKPKN